MTREQLAHVLRAAARIAGDPNILVVGSQAILGSYSEDELPEVAWMSIEADLAFFDDSSEPAKSDEVDGSIGELSMFHEEFSYYAQGVDLTTAKLPDGWEARLVPFQPASSAPAQAKCVEKHDLVISKLVAQREKDKAFARALLDAGLVDLPTLLERVEELRCVPRPTQQAVRQWLKGAAARVRT
jgi:hypothetical protein